MDTQNHTPLYNRNGDRKLKARFLALFLPGFLFVYLYSLALIESKYSVFMHLQPFRTGRPLTMAETLAFIALFSVELLALLLGLSFFLWRLYIRLFRRGRPQAAYLIPLMVLAGYFMTVTLQFQVLRYFKDGLNLMLARQLGGGSLWSALRYAVDELAQLAPLLVIGTALVVALLFLMARYGGRFLDFLTDMHWLDAWLRPKRLVLINLFAFIAAFGIAFHLPVLDKNLGYSLAHHLYLSPWRSLTDFDGDGYGLIPRPADQAPFDARRHPYALEILDNGVDEDGVGGDLEKNIWPVERRGSWNADLLARKNVILIVLESARADLYNAKYRNQWVMPTLRSLPGQELSMIAHTAFTAPAIVSIFNGTHSVTESSTASLIDRFNTLGYMTGVFSAQNEGFGKQDEKTGMKRSDHFFDARSASPEKRMYLSSSAIALSLPAPTVLAEAESWLLEVGQQPFFLYINLQELHFPYSYKDIPKPLIDNPIPRYSIEEDAVGWLRASYYNAARVVDSAIAEMIDFLKQQQLFDDTVIMIVGDHGEELFDAGSLGHGTVISYEQNSPLGKLINSSWLPSKNAPIGLSEIPKLLYNSLVKDQQHRLPLDGFAVAFLGVRKPMQLGLFNEQGLIRYDFRDSSWRRQAEYGAEPAPSPPYPRLIHLWESYLLLLTSERD